MSFGQNDLIWENAITKLGDPLSVMKDPLSVMKDPLSVMKDPLSVIKTPPYYADHTTNLVGCYVFLMYTKSAQPFTQWYPVIFGLFRGTENSPTIPRLLTDFWQLPLFDITGVGWTWWTDPKVLWNWHVRWVKIRAIEVDTRKKL